MRITVNELIVIFIPGIKVYANSSALKAESRGRALHDQVPSNIYLSKVLFSLKDRCLQLQFGTTCCKPATG
jgi:nucleoporin GLE1